MFKSRLYTLFFHIYYIVLSMNQLLIFYLCLYFHLYYMHLLNADIIQIVLGFLSEDKVNMQMTLC